MQRCVSLFGGGIDACSPGEEFCDYWDVSLLGCQVEGVKAVAVAGVDVGVPVEVLQHLLKVAATSRPEETGIVVRLERRTEKNR